MFDHFRFPFVQTDGDPGHVSCAGCGARLADGRQVTETPVEFPGEVFCDAECAQGLADLVEEETR